MNRARAGFPTVMLKYDLLSHLRRGIIGAYALVTLLYVLLLIYLPTEARAVVTLILLYTDTTALGFFFVGAIVQWEREERVYEGLFVTPLSPMRFIAVRAASLILIAVVVSGIISVAGVGVQRLDPLPLAVGLIGTSLIFIFLGIYLSVRTSGINSYFVVATAVMAPLFVPVLEVLRIWTHPLLGLLPTGAAVRLLEAGLGMSSYAVGFTWLEIGSGAGPLAVNAFDLWAAAAVLCLWAVGSAVLARRGFLTYILHTVGEEE